MTITSTHTPVSFGNNYRDSRGARGQTGLHSSPQPANTALSHSDSKWLSVEKRPRQLFPSPNIIILAPSNSVPDIPAQCRIVGYYDSLMHSTIQMALCPDDIPGQECLKIASNRWVCSLSSADGGDNDGSRGGWGKVPESGRGNDDPSSGHTSGKDWYWGNTLYVQFSIQIVSPSITIPLFLGQPDIGVELRRFVAKYLDIEGEYSKLLWNDTTNDSGREIGSFKLLGDTVSMLLSVISHQFRIFLVEDAVICNLFSLDTRSKEIPSSRVHVSLANPLNAVPTAGPSYDLDELMETTSPQINVTDSTTSPPTQLPITVDLESLDEAPIFLEGTDEEANDERRGLKFRDSSFPSGNSGEINHPAQRSESVRRKSRVPSAMHIHAQERSGHGQRGEDSIDVAVLIQGRRTSNNTQQLTWRSYASEINALRGSEKPPAAVAHRKPGRGMREALQSRALQNKTSLTHGEHAVMRSYNSNTRLSSQGLSSKRLSGSHRRLQDRWIEIANGVGIIMRVIIQDNNVVDEETSSPSESNAPQFHEATLVYESKSMGTENTSQNQRNARRLSKHGRQRGRSVAQLDEFSDEAFAEYHRVQELIKSANAYILEVLGEWPDRYKDLFIIDDDVPDIITVTQYVHFVYPYPTLEPNVSAGVVEQRDGRRLSLWVIIAILVGVVAGTILFGALVAAAPRMLRDILNPGSNAEVVDSQKGWDDWESNIGMEVPRKAEPSVQASGINTATGTAAQMFMLRQRSPGGVGQLGKFTKRLNFESSRKAKTVLTELQGATETGLGANGGKIEDQTCSVDTKRPKVILSNGQSPLSKSLEDRKAVFLQSNKAIEGPPKHTHSASNPSNSSNASTTTLTEKRCLSAGSTNEIQRPEETKAPKHSWLQKFNLPPIPRHVKKKSLVIDTMAENFDPIDISPLGGQTRLPQVHSKSLSKAQTVSPYDKHAHEVSEQALRDIELYQCTYAERRLSNAIVEATIQSCTTDETDSEYDDILDASFASMGSHDLDISISTLRKPSEFHVHSKCTSILRQRSPIPQQVPKHGMIQADNGND